MNITGIGRTIQDSPMLPAPAAAPGRGVQEAPTSRMQRAGSARPEAEPLTAEEQEFFARLFPESQAGSPALKTYSPAGVRPAGVQGTLFDRKG